MRLKVCIKRGPDQNEFYTVAKGTKDELTEIMGRIRSQLHIYKGDNIPLYLRLSSCCFVKLEGIRFLSVELVDEGEDPAIKKEASGNTKDQM